MVRELFEMARTKKACLIFFDEIDAVGGARFDDGAGGDNEVQRTMLELINQGRNVETSSSISVASSIVCSLHIVLLSECRCRIFVFLPLTVQEKVLKTAAA